MRKFYCDRCKRECDPNEIYTLALLSIPKETTDCFKIEEELGDFCEGCVMLLTKVIEVKKEG